MVPSSSMAFSEFILQWQVCRVRVTSAPKIFQGRHLNRFTGESPRSDASRPRRRRLEDADALRADALR